MFDLFVETKMTMREGLIRVLEQRLDSSLLQDQDQMPKEESELELPNNDASFQENP